ncbi:hypothetical protein BDF20DRAFT_874976 [Mycotypha africana]|uniref:uncharacterized protein n=1 Tax=Mycotypha africana TaxID=64632 RepID=UPI002301E998|nr:uncharacterized protein BDF20DRAFT_874976 [Mycotypha africana]KAI8977456.1 hypothetical protein BDF20DRAFT_874976 [Mycotypha africana]
MNSEKWEQLKNEIHTKCVAYDYSDINDSSLAIFITNLVRVGKTFEEVNSELLSMIGGDYDSNVTEWLFSRKNELETSGSTAEQSNGQELPNQKEQVLSDHEELVDSSKPEQTQFEPQQLNQKQPEEQNEEQPRDTSTHVERPKSRIFNHAIGALNPERRIEQTTNKRQVQSRHADPMRDRSRSPVRRSARNDRYNRSRYEQRDGRLDSHRTVQILPRNARDDGSSKGERPSVFDRLGPRSTARQLDNSRNVESDDQHVRYERSQLEQAEEVQSMDTDTHMEKPTVHNIKERCKYWPTCKNGENCPYFHPTRICPKFPNCPKPAAECTFIHPETDMPPQMAQPMMAKIPVPCKFFPYCANPVCPYIHPIFSPQNQQAAYFMQYQPNQPPTGHRVPILCRNGDACTRPGCRFSHPKDPNPVSEIICKFDGACTRPNCFYKHTKQNTTSHNKVLVNKPETSERQFSVPEDQVEERIIVGESADLISQQQDDQQQQNQQQ